MDIAVKTYALTESDIRDACVIVSCTEDEGSGFLVTENHVITAAHCVGNDASATDITVTFNHTKNAISLAATIVDIDVASDSCLLRLNEPVNIAPIALNLETQREGTHWIAYGYPASRGGIRHYLHGTIAQNLPGLKLGIDMDLSVDAACVLDEYSGVSGSAVVVENQCIALARISLDGTLGAVSMDKVAGLLIRNGILSDSKPEAPHLTEDMHAERGGFHHVFETFLLKHCGGAVLLQGSPGTGKTTFCRRYAPVSNTLAVAGLYEFTAKDGAGPAFKIQPEIFVDWLANVVSMQISGQSSRRGENGSTDLTRKVASLLDQYSEYWKQNGKKGVLFIDAINEALVLGSEVVSKFIALLPARIPENLILVFTAPSFPVVGGILSSWISPNQAMTLALLDDSDVLEISSRALASQSPTLATLRKICVKAKGHPLYLRYILEYLKAFPEDNDLEAFPVFSGSIETYYEKLWLGLVDDEHTVNLLGILSRLRWKIDVKALVPLLNSQEQAALVKTLARIRHLLMEEGFTELCHLSFGEFLKNKTTLLDTKIHGRLADFCLQGESAYCVINRIHHLLLAGSERHHQAAALCQQLWADDCVRLSAKPEMLIYDIRQTLACSLSSGLAVDTIRLLLLYQRISFRHNFLFLQSAYLSGAALIALGRADEALEQLMPSRHLVVDSIDTTLSAINFECAGFPEQGLALLERLKEIVDEEFERRDMDLREFIVIATAWIRAESLAGIIDKTGRVKSVVNYIFHTAREVRASIDEAVVSNEDLARYLFPLYSELEGVNIVFNDKVTTLKAIEKANNGLPDNMLELVLRTLLCVQDNIEQFRLPLPLNALKQAFVDLDVLLNENSSCSETTRFNAINNLIFFNAPCNLVDRIADIFQVVAPADIELTEQDEVFSDATYLISQGQQWRIAAYLDKDLPSPEVFSAENGWEKCLKSIAAAVFWCGGRARRAKAENDSKTSAEVIRIVREQILPALSFTLLERIDWSRAWAIPEQVVPLFYDELLATFVVCWPEEVNILTDFVMSRTEEQCGLYSEGYRRVLEGQVRGLSVIHASPLYSDMAFAFLEILHKFVSAYVENRQELVPALLRIIPEYVRLDARQLAEKTYEELLSISMGPTWYKEDQFSLMLDMLGAFPVADYSDQAIQQVAKYLEHASGELTFGQYILYEKSQLAGELIRQGKYEQAFAYYRWQVSASPREMLEQLSRPYADSPLPLKGMRFPGGALDEVHAVVRIVATLADAVEWRLRWAMLEIVCFDDPAKLASSFADLVNEMPQDAADVAEAAERIYRIVHGDVPAETQTKFVQNFCSRIEDQHSEYFLDMFSAFQEEQQSLPENTPERSQSEINNVAIQPGTIGKLSAVQEAQQHIEKAEKALARRNDKRASDIAIESLQILQDGEWSVWGNASLHPFATRQYILKDAKGAGEIFRRYQPLILNERHTAAWKMASYLIDTAAPFFTPEEMHAITQIVLEHNRILLGNVDVDNVHFGHLDGPAESDATEETLRFLFWQLEHPLNIRRDRALDAVKWLALKDDSIMKQCVENALTSNEALQAEALMALTDWMSRQNPQRIWGSIGGRGDIADLLQETKVLSQVLLLKRLAERAGASCAAEITAFTGSRTTLSLNIQSGELAPDSSPLPLWAQPVRPLLLSLQSQGLDISTLLSALAQRLPERYELDDIMTAYELELLLVRGFSVNKVMKSDRWSGMLCFELNRLLHENACELRYQEWEPRLRTWNVASEEAVEHSSVCERALNIIDLINDQKYQAAAETDGEYIVSYIDEFEMPHEGKTVMLEIIAVMTSEDDNHKANFPEKEGCFSATREPDNNLSLNYPLICQRVLSEDVLLGGCTPALVSPAFMERVGANPSDFTRRQWRSGRSMHKNRWGQPLTRGSMLTMNKRLKFPAGLGLAWQVKIDGTICLFFQARRG
ncbi:hypothetical protein L579_2649 [Pantoea sp. AS-PWVM4]|uniref:AVAST type 1 anti-phage system protease Avs1b n=1 Tax=Pantoea sp. AS-PWVM4 TaxID=1332069 RepID=UPI0003AC8134|nr:AVAST type 1 anti-phage system protease Avs1b [Pantoea sp. AS-PWVM4]ERK06189.1 hypothetical protein L579_2649 [Pantoea sp. AS-PWVM4]